MRTERDGGPSCGANRGGRHRAVAFAAVVALGITACSGDSDDDGTSTSEASPVSDVSVAAIDADASVAELVAAAPRPTEADPGASDDCARWGYTCFADVTDDQLLAGSDALYAIATAADGVDDPDEQLRLALAAALSVDDVSHVWVDQELATSISFALDGGPKMSYFTSAASFVDDAGDVADDAPGDEAGDAVGDEPGDAVTDSSVPPAATTAQGFASTAALPRAYDPAGGPLETPRTALVLNPFEWDEARGIAQVFLGNDEYGAVDVLDGGAVDPGAIASIGGYDAVHVLAHGGGSCPTWTDDYRDCSSTFGGGLVEASTVEVAATAGVSTCYFDSDQTLVDWALGQPGKLRWCFDTDSFPANPDGILFMEVCGSLGFNNSGAGASVGWTGTAYFTIAHATATEFWRMMITEGVSFAETGRSIDRRGIDDHSDEFFHQQTEANFVGRDLRGRDVIEVAIAGQPPQGQVVKFDGVPADGQVERLPSGTEPITLELDGVRIGSESAVQFEVRGDDTVWPADIDLERDGTRGPDEGGWADWTITLQPGAIEVPDVAWADLDPSAPPVELEIRAFEQGAEYTATAGTIRLATDVVSHGPLPIFTQLPRATGNDLVVTFSTAGGPVHGEMRVDMAGGSWAIFLTGTYDPGTGALSGTVEGAATDGGSIFNTGDGTFSGSANLPAGTVTIDLVVNGQSQAYVGTIGE